MLQLYEETNQNISMVHKRSTHIPPHIHKALEGVYVTKGSLELGIGEELYHMDEGDFGIIFPELIHHYQVFDNRECEAYYFMALPSLCTGFSEELQKLCPRYPIVKRENVEEDIVYAIKGLEKNRKCSKRKVIIDYAYVHIILASCFDELELVDKSNVVGKDIIYRAMAYISEHFRESVSLTKMARDLGVSQYVLSKLFSGTFHCNFNRYLNATRLDYAQALLLHTDQSITEVCMNAGFESQRTFNRVFLDRCRMTPREYRRGERGERHRSMQNR